MSANSNSIGRTTKIAITLFLPFEKSIGPEHGKLCVFLFCIADAAMLPTEYRGNGFDAAAAFDRSSI